MSDPDQISLALKIGGGVLVLWNFYVTVRLFLYGGYSALQKLLQLLIVWTLPIVGALLVHSLISPRVPIRREFYELGSGPPGTGSDVGHH